MNSAHRIVRENDDSLTDDLIRRAISAADPNVLRVVLLQLTGDKKYERMKLAPVAGRGGVLSSLGLAEEYVEEVRADAALLMRSGKYKEEPPPPNIDAARALLEVFLGRRITDRELAYYYKELAFEDAPFAVRWPTSRPTATASFKVVIVGAGISGIAMAIQLDRLGIPYVILERRHELGGTWSINTYPDARVDTTSFIYQYKFEKHYPWTEYYARQAEVRKYLEFIARKYGIFEKIRFNVSAESGEFDECSSVWRLKVSDGETVSANFVVSATGLFSTPRALSVKGIEGFTGTTVHSTNWSSDVPVAEKSVAIVGNGSTGVQLLAPVAEDAKQVYVFQRTPQWIAPTEQYRDPIEVEVQWLLDELPYYWNWFCFSRVVPYFSMAPAQTIDPEWRTRNGGVNERNDAIRRSLTTYIETQLEGREDLIEKVVPPYPPLARRLIIDNGWYKALLRPNVEIITTPIREVLPDGIITEDGKKYPVDTLITATGFTTTKYVWPAVYRGRDGLTLEDLWQERGPRAYLGLCTPGFPNFFMMYGPNGQTRSSGLIPFVEQWARFIALAMGAVIERGGRSVEVKSDAYLAYNAEVDEASRDIVWNLVSAERNYYLNEHGRQHVSAPWVADHSYEMLRAPNLDHFVLD